MKKIFCILLLILFFLGCSKKEKEYSEKIATDSLSYYMKLSNDKKLTSKERIQILNKAYNISSFLKNTSKNRDTLYSITYQYYSLKDWYNFNKVSLVLYKNSLESKDSINLNKVYRYRAGYYKNTQVYDSSFYYYLKGEKLSILLNDKINLAIILLNKGIVQYNVNDYLGAELSLTRAYNIFKYTNEKDKIYGTLNQLGLVYNELKDYDRAAEYHLKALQTVREFNLQNTEHQEAVCFNNLGYLFIKQKEYVKASKNFELALRDDKIINDDPDLYAYLIDNLAYCRFHFNSRKDVPKLFFEALNIRKKLEDKTIVFASYLHLSEYYQKDKNLLLAKKYSIDALKIAKESKIPINIILALKQASLVDDKNNLKYSEDYIRISDSLQVVERNSKDRFARIELETNEIKQEKDQLVEKNRNILNYFMGAIIIGGFLFFVRIQRSRSRELVLKQSQQQANEEIYRLIISHQNQLEEGRDLEKRRISKELHDGVLGRLFGLRLNLDGLNNYNDEEAKHQRLDYLNELKVIEQDLREISHELNRENLVLINNFVAIINNLLEQQAKINSAKIKSIIAEDIDWDKLPNTAKINLYRILQEALQNINKYAEANTILVHFRKDKKGNLLFNIEDDGIGYDLNSKKSKGIGMKNIVARTQQCQGIIDIKSEIGKGSKIIITFPLENKTIKV